MQRICTFNVMFCWLLARFTHVLFYVSRSLLQEVEAKLSEAIKAGDLDKTAVAHDLLEIGRKRLTQATTDLSSLAELID